MVVSETEGPKQEDKRWLRIRGLTTGSLTKQLMTKTADVANSWNSEAASPNAAREDATVTTCALRDDMHVCVYVHTHTIHVCIYIYMITHTFATVIRVQESANAIASLKFCICWVAWCVCADACPTTVACMDVCESLQVYMSANIYLHMYM